MKSTTQHDLCRLSLSRFALDGPVLPLVTDMLPLAEQVRISLLRHTKAILRRHLPEWTEADLCSQAPAFWGKDELRRPRTGHQHAFFLPTDEDRDGRLDHVTVLAEQGFTLLERQALDRLRRVPFGSGDPLTLLLLGLGRSDQFRAPLLDAATVWVSATPFVVTRYPKLRGRKRDQPADYATPYAFARHVLAEELARLRERRADLPALADPELLDGMGPQGHYRAIQFQRSRRKPGDDGGRRAAAGFRLTFASPVRGPLCLGHNSHFGLGLFVPEP